MTTSGIFPIKTSGEKLYVVFNSKHTINDELYTEEKINGKRIYTYIICINFDRAINV